MKKSRGRERVELCYSDTHWNGVGAKMTDYSLRPSWTAMFACVAISSLALAAMTDNAHALNVDWKMYGGVADAGQSVCFYDRNGLVKQPDGHIRVWTKCLPRKELDAAPRGKKFGSKIVENAATKFRLGYVPPIASLENMNTDQRVDVITYETTADISDVEPQATIFYELNCPQRMMRELSINLHVNGKRGSSDKPGDWKYVPPEGNGARLLSILCPLH
jgi:hypothetical protein